MSDTLSERVCGDVLVWTGGRPMKPRVECAMPLGHDGYHENQWGNVDEMYHEGGAVLWHKWHRGRPE